MSTDLVTSWVVVIACLSYGIAAWLVQMYRVAPPRDWLLERIWFIRAQIASDNWSIGTHGEDDLKKVERAIARSWLLVAVSKVQSGWRNVHGLEDEHVLELAAATVDERLQTARTRLMAIGGVEAASLVKRIDSALEADHRRDKEWAALLREAEVFRHNFNDTNYEDLANLLGKGVWLSWISLAIVAALAALFDRESYFLLGAAGALVSRLSRVFPRRPKASDYGAEWSTLILSPAAGALAGWVGVAIIVALASDPFKVFGDALLNPWSNAASPVGLVLAFAFGFSERLFNRLLGIAERAVGGKLTEKEAPNLNGNDTNDR